MLEYWNDGVLWERATPLIAQASTCASRSLKAQADARAMGFKNVNPFLPPKLVYFCTSKITKSCI